MKKVFRTLLPVGMILSIGLVGCAGRETVRRPGRVSYRSFADTYTLTNGRVVVVVAPRVGRIIAYHRAGESNLLWLDAVPTLETTARAGMEWINYGGDKVWLAPMSVWPNALGRRWPPDATTDGNPWRVLRAEPRRLVMASGLSSAHGARITRTITLPDDSTTVRIGHHLERVRNDPYPVQVWTVTQVHMPDYGLLDLAEDRPVDVRSLMRGKNEDMTVTEDRNLGVVRCDWPRTEHAKTGVFGRWVAAVYGRTIFAQYAALNVSGNYDDQANCEIYANPMQEYVELELLSAAKNLPAGGSMDFTVTWKLLDHPLVPGLAGVVKTIESHTPVPNP